MPLLAVHTILALQNSERQHLREVDEAIRDVLIVNAMAASANGLDAAIVGKATVTVLLVAAIREAMLSCERANRTFDFMAFCDVATEAATWMATRSSVNHARALN